MSLQKWCQDNKEKKTSSKALVADKKTGCNAASALANHEDHMGCLKMYPAEEFYLQADWVQAIILQALAPRDKINLRGVNQIELKTHVVKLPQETGKQPIKHKGTWSEMSCVVTEHMGWRKIRNSFPVSKPNTNDKGLSYAFLSLHAWVFIICLSQKRNYSSLDWSHSENREIKKIS